MDNIFTSLLHSPDLWGIIKPYLRFEGRSSNFYKYEDGVCAVSQGYLQLMKERHRLAAFGRPDLVYSGDCLELASKKGNLEMVKWLHHVKKFPVTSNVMTKAASSGNLDLVKWLVDKVPSKGEVSYNTRCS